MWKTMWMNSRQKKRRMKWQSLVTKLWMMSGWLTASTGPSSILSEADLCLLAGGLESTGSA